MKSMATPSRIPRPSLCFITPTSVVELVERVVNGNSNASHLEVKLNCRFFESFTGNGILDFYTEIWRLAWELYSRHILPRLINFAMSDDEMTRLREAHVPAARGVVLEIGIGSGLNLPFYSSAVTKVYGVDPSRELLAMARPKADGFRFPSSFCNRKPIGLPLGDRSVDTAVVTWSLCSIGDPGAALREMWRVLRPGGNAHFCRARAGT